MPHLVAQPQRPAPDRGHHQQPERAAGEPGELGAQRQVQQVEQRPVPVVGDATAAPGARRPPSPPGRRSAGGSQDDVDPERRRAAREPGGQRELQPEDRQRQEPQGDRELEEEAPPRLQLGRAEPERGGGDRARACSATRRACGRSSPGAARRAAVTPGWTVRCPVGSCSEPVAARVWVDEDHTALRRIQREVTAATTERRRTEPRAGVRGQAAWMDLPGGGKSRGAVVDEGSRAHNNSLLIRY